MKTTPQGPAKTVKIGGKDYVTVDERVRLAHSSDGYQILESSVFPVDDRWFYQVKIEVEGRTYIGTSEVKFKNAKAGSADATAPLECAETSAVGRALAFAGIGVEDGIASADEMQRSAPSPQREQQREQRTTAPEPLPSYRQHPPVLSETDDVGPQATEQQLRAIANLRRSLGDSDPQADDPNPMTIEYARNLIAQLSERYQTIKRAG